MRRRGIQLPSRRRSRLRLAICGLALVAALALPVASATADRGRLDPHFGKQGRTVVPLELEIPKLWYAPQVSAASAPGGETVVAAGSLLIRLRADGRVDTGFATAGFFDASAAFGVPVDIAGIAVDGEGRVVAVATTGPTSQAMILRLTADGTLDPSFGSGGVLSTDFGLPPPIGGPLPAVLSTHVAIDPQGRVLVSGTHLEAIPYCSLFGGYAARLLGDGSLDSSFGSGGVVAFSTTTLSLVEAMGLSSEGSPLLIGRREGCKEIEPPPFSVTQLDGSGVADPAFDSSAAQVGQEMPRGITVDGSGRIIVLEPTGVFRLLPSGRPDPAFGRRGYAAVHIGSRQSKLSGVAVTPGEGLVLTGTFVHYWEGRPEPRRRAVLIRLGSRGRQDMRLGRGGVVRAAYGKPSNVAGREVLLDRHGEATVVGLVRNQRLPTGQGVALFRFQLR